ncbi:50S ribosomal protein L25 [Clostridium sp. CS001]|uniref:50S ribosomal protein L25 n=1 Tax=Clostridium sp. CS001 TaxID=2880648 RepID=UPI001CF31274|nr:50S ribosomal protein L25 [Clostridium sp. CS001]MCB2289063.1 50S ribosomal protein L25 [Clostridium sp. CS001]
MEKLEVKKREKKAHHSARRDRREGKVPGIMYGKNLKNLMFEVGELELNSQISRIGEHGVLDITINGDDHNVLIKEIQREPVNQKIIHIDFEELYENSRVITEVPIKFLGENTIGKNGDVLQKERTSIKVQCTAVKIPKSVEVDVSNLNAGDSYRVADVEFAKEISIIDSLSLVIATVTKVKKYNEDMGETEIENEL